MAWLIVGESTGRSVAGGCRLHCYRKPYPNEMTRADMPVNDLKLGTDLVRIDRVRRGMARYGMRYLRRFLTADEVDYCVRNGTPSAMRLCPERAAGRIAMKEAVSKALGVGLRGMGYAQGIGWHEVWMRPQPNSAPTLGLAGYAAKLKTEQGITAWRLSMSHDATHAMATVVGLMSST